jgi:mono/diheme cytochrome c family protein
MLRSCPVFLLAVALFFFWANACQRDPYREGARLYGLHCANCHGDQGQGLGELIPPLAQADYLAQHRDRLACILVKGLADTIVVNNKTYAGQPMPPNANLSDVQVSNILNYIHNNWGNQLPDFQLEEVRRALQNCQ